MGKHTVNTKWIFLSKGNHRGPLAIRRNVSSNYVLLKNRFFWIWGIMKSLGSSSVSGELDDSWSISSSKNNEIKLHILEKAKKYLDIF